MLFIVIWACCVKGGAWQLHKQKAIDYICVISLSCDFKHEATLGVSAFYITAYTTRCSNEYV